MRNPKIHDEPSDVSVEAGEVMVDGPGGVAVSFTPEAAIDTASRLIDAAAVAHGDKAIEEERRKSPH